MSNNTRIFNITRKFSLKHSQALKAIENCACTWVVFGVSIRDLTLAEKIQAMHQQAKDREPLPLAEIHGIKFKPPTYESEKMTEISALIRQANQLVVT